MQLYHGFSLLHDLGTDQQYSVELLYLALAQSLNVLQTVGHQLYQILEFLLGKVYLELIVVLGCLEKQIDEVVARVGVGQQLSVLFKFGQARSRVHSWRGNLVLRDRNLAVVARRTLARYDCVGLEVAQDTFGRFRALLLRVR